MQSWRNLLYCKDIEYEKKFEDESRLGPPSKKMGNERKKTTWLSWV